MAASTSYRLPRAMRLKRTRLIRSLFDRRREDVGTVATGCVRLLFRVVPLAEAGTTVPVQIGFSPGRAARKSVQRNRIKRLLREVYRVRQHLLVDLFVHRKKTLIVMVLYRGTVQQATMGIPHDLPRSLHRLHDLLVSIHTEE